MKKKIIYIIVLILLILVGVGVFLFLNNNKPEPEKSDNVKFSEEYTEVSLDNVFVYRDAESIISIMKEGTGVVYLGFPECPWCQSYVKYLNETAKEVGIDKIYYFNILEERKNNTKAYQEIVEILKTMLQKDDEGNPRIFVPNVSFHVKGELIGNDYETSLDTHDKEKPSEYWTEKEVNDLKKKLKKYMNEVLKEISKCTDCNK